MDAERRKSWKIAKNYIVNYAFGWLGCGWSLRKTVGYSFCMLVDQLVNDKSVSYEISVSIVIVKLL